MGQLAGQRGSFRAGQRGAADGAAGRARSKLDSHLPQPTALSPARPLRCAATWLRKKKPLPSKTHSKRCTSVCSLCFRGLSIAIALIGGPPRWGQLCRCWPRGGGLCGMFARLCRGVASRAPRYALARAPARGMQGLPASAAPPTTGARKTGGAGAKAAPAGLPSALAAPITTADPRMQEVGTEDKPKQKPFPKLPPDPPCAGQAVPRSWHAGRTPSEPATTLRKIGPDHRRGCAELPHRRRAAGTSAHPPSQRPARGWRGACSSWLGAALRVQASRLWTGGSRCPRRPSR